MQLSIEEMKYKIATLEGLVQGGSASYVAGYIEALKDNQLLLSDVSEDQLKDEYLAWLYKKAFDMSR